MSSMSRSLALTLGFVALTAAVPAAPALAATEATDTLPPDHFSTDVTGLAKDGWRLALISIDDSVDGNGERTFAVIMVKDAAALKLSLAFTEYGESVSEYRREKVAMPGEARVYDDASSLIDALASGRVTQLYEECGSYYLQTTDQSALINEYGYYVIDRQVRGKAAGTALASELNMAFDAGMTLSDVHRDDANDKVIELVFAGDHGRVLRAELDAKGKVIAFEARRSPSGEAWRRVNLDSTALTSIKKGKTVKSLSFQDQVEDVAPRLQGTMQNGKKFTIDLADVEELGGYGGGDCGC